MNEYFESLLMTINGSIRSLDEESFQDLVDDIVSALDSGHKAIATGLGKNVPICEKFEGTMLSMGLDAKFLHTNTAAHGDLGAVRNGDVVMVLSKSGETVESLYLLEQLKKRDVVIWAITFDGSSTLAVGADRSLVIPMDHEGDEWDIVPNNSTTLNLIVLQAVAITVAERMGVTLGDFKRNHPGGAIGVKLNG